MKTIAIAKKFISATAAIARGIESLGKRMASALLTFQWKTSLRAARSDVTAGARITSVTNKRANGLIAKGHDAVAALEDRADKRLEEAQALRKALDELSV